MTELPMEIESHGMVCKPINAAVTAYIATSGNGTIVDPDILKTSVLKFIQTKMKERAFVSDDMPFMSFIGIRSEAIQAGTTSTPRPEPPQKQTPEPDASKSINVMGTIILTLFCTVIISIIFAIYQKVKSTKKKKQPVQYTTTTIERNLELS